MGGSKVKVPGPSPQELASLEAQTRALEQQSKIIQAQYQQQQLLAPFLYKSAGIQPVTNEAGEITGYEEIADPIRQLEKDVQQKFLERTGAALRGEIPLDPGLVRSLDEQERQLNERLRKQLGPGYATSTPGIQALDEFMRSRENMYDAARRGDLTLAEQLGLAQGQANQQKLGDLLAQASGINASPLASASAFGQNAAGYNSPLSYWSNRRNQQLQANIANRSTGGFGQLFQGLGSLAGQAFLGGAKPWIFG